MSRPNICSDTRKPGIGAGITMPVLYLFVFSFSGLLLLLQGCGQSKEEMDYREASAAMSDSISSALPGIAADTVGGIAHHFVRNADLKCEVENVLAVTKRVEDLITINGGYVSKSDLVSSVSHRSSVRFREDSLLESTAYTIGNNMLIRVPARQLDTVLRVITDLALFVDHRRQSSDDVKMQLYANLLAQKRLAHYNKQVEKKTGAQAAPLNQLTAAAESVLQKQAQADDRQVAGFDLADHVNYSTITLELYQQGQEQQRVVAAPLRIQPYEPDFAGKLGKATLNGFEVLKACILFLVNSWGLLLILALLWLGVKKLVLHSKAAGQMAAKEE